MADKYKIKEVNVALTNGITVKVEIEKIENLKDLIDDLKTIGLLDLSAKPADKPEQQIKNKKEKEEDNHDDNPLSKVELRADLDGGILTSKKVLGFKNGIPQLFKPGSIAPTESLLVLLFAIENGLNLTKISFDEFKAIFEGQGIKSGTPLNMLTTNVKNANYIDKKTYDNDRHLTLSSKGADKAKEILKKLVK
jgi:hypothetical protein